jgi:hypothetical protein
VKRRFGFAVAVVASSLAPEVRAEGAPPCSSERGPAVVLRAGAAAACSSAPCAAPRVPHAEVARQLAGGLAPSGVRVCVDQGPREGRVAQVEVEDQRGTGVLVKITLHDDVTTKTLQRSIDLSAIPADSRALAISVYVEELLQASWAELALGKRVYLRSRQSAAPAEVRREVAKVMAPARRPREPPRFRASVGAAVAGFHGGLVHAGPELDLGVRVLRWLEGSVHLGYRFGPDVAATHGAVANQALVGGLAASLVLPEISGRLTVVLPQALYAARVDFDPEAKPGAVATGASRFGVYFSHGAGARFALGPTFSLTGIAAFCWTARPAEAADGRVVVTGIAGAGGAARLTFDTHF